MKFDHETMAEKVMKKIEEGHFAGIIDDIHFIVEPQCPDDRIYAWVSPKTYRDILDKQKPEDFKND